MLGLFTHDWGCKEKGRQVHVLARLSQRYSHIRDPGSHGNGEGLSKGCFTQVDKRRDTDVGSRRGYRRQPEKMRIRSERTTASKQRDAGKQDAGRGRGEDVSSQGQVKVVLAVLVSLLPPLLLASPFLFHMRELAPRLHNCQTHFLPVQATQASTSTESITCTRRKTRPINITLANSTCFTASLFVALAPASHHIRAAIAHHHVGPSTHRP